VAPPAAWIDHALDELRRSGYRSGGARSAVVGLLADQDCCLSAQEIFDGLRAQGRRVGIASVYRVLDLLTTLKLVQRLDVGGDVARYEPAHPDGDHHHHLLCGGCGRLVTFEDERLERALERLAGERGFLVETHEIVLRGACRDCAAATA
jgi:Fur family ferric uptake transcriptional regulator